MTDRSNHATRAGDSGVTQSPNRVLDCIRWFAASQQIGTSVGSLNKVSNIKHE